MMESQAEIKARNRAALWSLLLFMGTRKRLADTCSVTPQTVYYWIQRGRISATCAKIVDKKTGGRITKEQLRADVEDWSI